MSIAGLQLNVHAQEQVWKTIAPYKECPALHIEYTTKEIDHEKRYIIRKKIAGSNKYKKFPTPLYSLDSLNELQGFMSEDLKIYCPDYKAVSIDLNKCLYDNTSANPLQDDFMSMIRDVLALSEAQDLSCDEWEQTLLLTQGIESMQMQEREFVDKSKKLHFGLVKLFLNKDYDLLVDEYAKCGGKANSDLFVRNMILIEARHMCIFPTPEGSLSWDEALEMANKVSQDYKNLNLLQVAGSRKKISYSVMKDFVTAIASKSLKEILPDKSPQELNKLIEESENYKHLTKKLENQKKKFKFGKEKVSVYEHNMDYVSEVLSNDLTFEVAEKILPDLAVANFSPSLPDDWNEQKKRDFIDANITDDLNKKYNSCIKDIKAQLNVRTSADEFTTDIEEDHTLIASRKEQKAKFCANNPDLCPENSCSAQSSYREDADAKHNELTKIQSCIYAAFGTGIPKIISLSIQESMPPLKTLVKNPEKTLQDLQLHGKKVFNQCLNTKTKSFTGKDFYDESNRENTYHNELLNVEQFSSITKDCAFEVEDSLTETTIRQVLSEMDILFKNIPEAMNKEKVIDKIVQDSYYVCREELNKIKLENPNYEFNYSQCSAAVEIITAKEVIFMELSKHLDSIPNTLLPKTQMLSTFETCVNEDFNNFISTLKEPVTNYLDSEDSKLYDCTKDILTAASHIVVEHEFTTVMQDKDSGIKDKRFVKKLIPEVQMKVSRCLTNQLDEKAKVWSEFVSKTSSEELLNKSLQYCSVEAEVYAAPKIMINEATNELLALTNDQLIFNQSGNRQIGNILALTAYSLRKQYGVELPADIKSNDVIEWSLQNALRSHIANGGTQQDFVKEYSALVEKNALKTVHTNLFDEIQKLPNSSSLPIKTLSDTLTPTCLKNIFDHIDADDFKTGNTSNSNETTFESISKVIHEGLVYARKHSKERENQVINLIKQMCANSDSYKNLADITNSKAFDFILKAQIHQKVISGLKETIEKNYQESLLDIKSPAKLEAARKKFVIEKYNTLSTLISEIDEPQKIEQLLYSKKEILTYARAHFTKLLDAQTQESKILSTKITTQLFSNYDKGGFVDKFISAQIKEGIGVNGLEEARTSAGKQATIGFKNEAVRSIDKVWTPKGIGHYLSWNTIDETQRTSIIDSVVKNVIIPQANGESGKPQKVEDKIKDHTSNYVYSSDQKTFEDRISDDVTALAKGDFLGFW